MGEFAGYLMSNLPSLAVVAVVYFVLKRQLSDSRAVNERLELSSDAHADDIHRIKRDKRELRKEVGMLKEEITNERSRRAEEIGQITSKDRSGAQHVATLEQRITELAALLKKHGELSDEFDGIIEKLESLSASVTELVNKVDAREGREQMMIANIDEKLRTFAAERVRYHETLKAVEDKEIGVLSSLLGAESGASREQKPARAPGG
jgi:chromosome segregation ATPase